MRSSDKRLLVGISISTAIAMLVVASLTGASQARMGGGMSMGGRGGQMSGGMAGARNGAMMRSGGPALRSGGATMRTRGAKFHSANTAIRSGVGTKNLSTKTGLGGRKGPRNDVVTKDGGTSTAGRTGASGVNDTGRNTRTKDGGYPNRGDKGGDKVGGDPGRGEPGRGEPGRGRPGGNRPGLGIAVGTGVIIGTGVAIGAVGPVDPAGAVALPPGGAPPTGGGLPPSGGPPSGRNGINIPPADENRFVKDEVVLEFAGNFPRTGILQLLSRHRLSLIESQSFTLTNSTIVRAHIRDRRAVRAVLQGLGGEVTLYSGQPNYLYQASQGQNAAQPETVKPTPAVATAAAIPAGGDPAQYALAKLRIGEAHTLANGDKIVVAVIDSGIDLSHPELAGAVAGSFDALGKSEKPHQHGTAIAGAIAAHSRLMGAAPAAKILAIRAFGATGGSAEATTMAILKSVEYASTQRVRIINMSFAGPADPALSRELAAAKANGAVLIAATGNFGPKSPPQYPAADPNVIAVSATDADDNLFRASNIGPHVAVAAPGVDILLPSPGNDYRLISGTSFSAAYVSGVAALVLQRAPGLTPDGVRRILEQTAKDLGPVGKDPEFGAGLVDAYQAIVAVQANATASAQDVQSMQPKEAEAGGNLTK